MYYKFTDKKLQTYDGFQWMVREWYSIENRFRNKGYSLCTEGFFHCYNDSLVGVFLNPAHARIYDALMFHVNVKGKRRTDHGLKFGFTHMRLAEQVVIPQVTNINTIAFGILTAMYVYRDPTWQKWAEDWLASRTCNHLDARSVASRAANHATSAATSTALWYVGEQAAKAAIVAARATPLDLIAIAKQAMKIN